MKFNSIQFKLTLIIVLGFLVTTFLVQFIVGHNMTSAINLGQEAEYGEKLQTVLQTIQNNHNRLQKTGMVSTYQEDFQNLTLRQLRQTYLQPSNMNLAPFLVDAAGQLLLRPLGAAADSDGYSKTLIQQTKKTLGDSFTFSVPGEGEVWCVSRVFEPWGWTVGYLVPLEVKYQMANQLSRILWLVFGGVTLLVVSLLVWAVRVQLRPIAILTEISAEMAQGNLERQIPTGRRDEIGILADHFNRMQFAIKQNIESLQSSEENLRTTLDSLCDAVIATDPELRITRMNPVAEKLTGWSVGDALGQPLETIFQIVNEETRKTVANPAKEVLAQGKVVALSDNTLLIAKNGREHLISDTAAPILNADQQLLGVVLVFRDVTEEKDLQEQLLQIRKMETIGQLAGGVAHDFNNMLGGIIGAAGLLKRRLPEDQKNTKFLGMILESAERAADLTAKLLTFSRKQTVSSTPVDAHLALRNALSLLENTVDRSIRVTSDFGADLSTVVGDSTQLQNAFLNLCINAAHAMPEGGELSISTRTLELDEFFCENSSFDLEPGPYLEFEFRDNGCGIPTAQLKRIFEPFYTTKKPGHGTGLGLSAVLGTVQAHKGAVTVYSEVGTGTAFRVLLPLIEAEIQAVAPLSRPRSGSGLILIADDEPVMRATAGAILEDLGYQVLLAENGLVGLELFRQKGDEIDLVLLDMVMPEMNGRDCFAEIRKIDSNAQVLLSSGFTQTKDLEDLHAAGLAGFIRKPYRAVDLSQKVADAMRTDGKATIL